MRNREMDLQQLAKRRLARVVPDFNRLGVIRPAAAYGPVVCSIRTASRVAVANGYHSTQLAKHRFDAPKTSACKHRRLLCRPRNQWRINPRIREIFDRNSA